MTTKGKWNNQFKFPVDKWHGLSCVQGSCKSSSFNVSLICEQHYSNASVCAKHIKHSSFRIILTKTTTRKLIIEIIISPNIKLKIIVLLSNACYHSYRAEVLSFLSLSFLLRLGTVVILFSFCLLVNMWNKIKKP